MTKYLTKRNIIIASVAGVILVGATVKAVADDNRGFGGSVTLDTMLEKVGEKFDETDTDGNGVISQAEADAAMASQQEKMGDRMASMFERMDSDGDGVISEGDRGYDRISSKLGVEGDISLEQVQAAMADKMSGHSMGADGDAPTFPLTRADALAAAEARFAEADVDGDGVLDRSEMPGRGGKGHGNR